MSVDGATVGSTGGNTVKALAWTGVALLGSLLVASLSIPWDLPESIYADVQRGDLFHGEWLVAGTLLAIPVARAARASWKAALVVIVVPGAQMLYVADTAVDTVARFGLATGADELWYVLAFMQVALFAVAGAVGAHRGIVERRWIGYLAELTRERPALIPGTPPD